MARAVSKDSWQEPGYGQPEYRSESRRPSVWPGRKRLYPQTGHIADTKRLRLDQPPVRPAMVRPVVWSQAAASVWSRRQSAAVHPFHRFSGQPVSARLNGTGMDQHGSEMNLFIPADELNRTEADHQGAQNAAGIRNIFSVARVGGGPEKPGQEESRQNQGEPPRIKGKG